MSQSFKTPNSSRKNSRPRAFGTPVARVGTGKDTLTIPASPAMKKMGFGTGVTVFLYERYSPNRGKFGSPWAVKKVNSKLPLAAHGSEKDGDSGSPIVKRTQTIEEMCNGRLAAEAKLLRSFNHPNIIGFRDYTTAADGTKCLAMESGETDLYSIIEDLVDAEETDPLPAAAITRVSVG
ncbi:Protein kinase-like domain [Trinorchestia longiramus]|nr:Protein kinase-like domain [Trinorchestia longiramus]